MADNVFNINSTTALSTGKEGCRCIDVSSILASFTERSCTTSDGEEGVLVSLSTTSVPKCAPHTFGSSSCLLHDLSDPRCEVKSTSGPDIPAYCIRPWCYVDAKQCMGESEERVIRSSYFPAGSGVDLFYSYSTCGSSADEWLKNQEHVLGGMELKATVPRFNAQPWVYKVSEDGSIPVIPGSEYYNNSIPFEGVHVQLVKSLQDVAKGDFAVSWGHGSRASSISYPSPFNAAIQDIEDGIFDIVVGPFWITPDRLKRTAFTIPIHHDVIVLVIPQPGTSNTFIEETEKIFDPFSKGVWGLILATITLTALLSVWFSGRGRRRSRSSGHSRRSVYTRLAADEFLQKGMFFCSAGIEQDTGANLSHKLLMFGFGFFILIVVSAYVANLAAFLTRNSSDHVGTIGDVIAKGWNICAHPVLRKEFELAHPDAEFIFSQEGNGFYGVIEDYDAKKCQVMAIGKMDSVGDIPLMNEFCKRKLVFTESVVIENPVGFPIRAELASGFSYWISQAEKFHGISHESSFEKYNDKYRWKPRCEVILSEQSGEEDTEYTSIKAKNLIGPIIFYVSFAIIAVILQLYHKFTKKHNPNLRQLIGSYSTLNFNAGTSNKDRRPTGKIEEDDEEHPLGVANVGREGSIVLDSRGATVENQIARSISPLQVNESEDSCPSQAPQPRTTAKL